MSEISVAVVDDHPIVREGLIQVIGGFGGFRVTVRAIPPRTRSTWCGVTPPTS